MKFAKELERELVPEWRVKYLNYKAGKKLIKQINKALSKANGTPHSRQFPDRFYGFSSSTRPTPNGGPETQAGGQTGATIRTNPERPSERTSAWRTAVSTGDLPAHSAPQPIPSRRERQSLTRNSPRFQYGSFILTPPNVADAHPLAPPSTNDDDFALPDPAIRSTPSQTQEQRPHGTRNASTLSLGTPGLADNHNNSSPGGISNNGGRGGAKKLDRQRTLTRLFSTGAGLGSKNTLDPSDISLHVWDQVKKRNGDFFKFLEDELKKVEDFYKLKETQAGQRLDLLREQLHEMRNRRTYELLERKRRKDDVLDDGKGILETIGEHHGTGWIDPIKSKMFRPGPNSKALQKMARTPVFAARNEPQNPDDRRDYVRRPADDDVPYRTAKRKLKLALQEFYRGLELLKAYAILNRTAFRKLNKKYDKAVNARNPYKFMVEHVNKAWFVNSDVLDQHIRTVEDLYARYFERGNHKLAVGKLRSKKGAGDESGSAFRCGILLGTGLVFAIQGMISGARILIHSQDAEMRLNTSYLLQVYGGYFLMLYLFLLFCLDCRQWTKSKVNYPFIFEFDPRHNLDWRQLAEFPCFFMFLFGIIFWLNFTGYGGLEMYLWWPVILIAVTVVIIFLPLPVLGHKGRAWFVYSHWRLLLAGIYPVEFRDFFLGDIYCSLTYAVCNVELFFCLYGNEWENIVQCNSNHSRLMGFLTALPAIWRALQCIRRYYDTGNVFPHLVNCGKYAMTIMSAVTLSMYRIERADSNLALFIAFSTINGFYASFWDLFMDFSLMQGHSQHFLLRDILAFKNRWWYYAILLVDPVLRFSWVFYAIFTHNLQHSALVSFIVAMAEATRRGAWAMFRVENEHSSNVKQYKASRDVPLPYRIEPLVEGVDGGDEYGGSVASAGSAAETILSEVRASGEDRRESAPSGAARSDARGAAASTTGREDEGVGGSGGGIRRRRRATSAATSTVRGLGRILAEAHKQDFEKKRRPDGELEGDDGDDDDDDDEEEEDEIEDEYGVGGVIRDESNDGDDQGGRGGGNVGFRVDLEMAGANGSGRSARGTPRTRGGGESVRSSRR